MENPFEKADQAFNELVNKHAQNIQDSINMLDNAIDSLNSDKKTESNYLGIFAILVIVGIGFYCIFVR